MTSPHRRVALIVPVLALGLALGYAAAVAGRVQAGACDDAPPEWLACEDFEAGGLGWERWFAASPWVECNGCPDGRNDPARIRLVDDPAQAHSGRWSLHMPAEASAGYQGASLTWRDCAGEKREGCRLTNHERLFFRAHVRLAEDHAYVHHFLEVAGTQPDRYWESDGNAGCRPDGRRWAGTTLDFNRNRELFFYTYFPQMRCDRGNYCSGDYARQLCAGCAAKGMACPPTPECCWGNHFGPVEPVTLDRGRWVCLEIELRLNTPGQSDGEMAFWVDGLLAHRQPGMRWRETAAVGLNKAWLMHYIAAGDATRSNRVWFDDVVVSTAPIGCGFGPAPLRTATTAAPPSPTATTEPTPVTPAAPSATSAPPAPVETATPAGAVIALPRLEG